MNFWGGEVSGGMKKFLLMMAIMAIPNVSQAQVDWDSPLGRQIIDNEVFLSYLRHGGNAACYYGSCGPNHGDSPSVRETTLRTCQVFNMAIDQCQARYPGPFWYSRTGN